MKKLLAVIMTLAIYLQIPVQAAGDVALTQDSYQSRLDMLTALSVMSDNGIKADETISRAAFITTILNFSNNAVDQASASGTVFEDVDKDYAYAAQIEKGAALGYMKGYSTSEFYPEAPVTYTQAIKVIVSMLGYDIYALRQGGYPDGYLAVASTLRIMDGVKQTGDDLTMESLVTMLCNACECPVLEYDMANNTYKSGKEDNDTALYYFHKIAKVKGIVSANDVTGLKSIDGACSEGQVIIDGEDMYVGLTDARKMLGYSVTAYVYYRNEQETGEIKYIANDPRNRTLTVRSRNILKDDASFSGTDFVYENETGSRRSIKIGPDTAVIFNGEAKPLYSISDIAVQLGDVTFIDNNGDGAYDCVNIFSVTKAIIPEFISDTDKEITVVDYFDTSNMYSYKKDYEYYDVTMDGEQVSFTNIKTDMIVLVGEGSSGMREHSVTRAYMKDVKIAGIVKARDDETVNIGGTEYEFSPMFDDTQLVPNSIGYFWIHDGMIFGYQKSNIEINGEMVYADRYDYGYLISAVYACESSDEAEQILQLKLLTSANEFERYRVTDNTIYNGKRVKDRYEAAKLFAKSWSGDSFVFEPQLLKYKLDDDNNLKEVFTAAYPEGLRYEGNVNTNFKDPNNKTVIRVEKNGVVSLIDKSNIAQYGFYVDTWLNFFYQDDDTVVFHINDSDLDSSYASGKFQSASTPNEGNFIHEFYNVDEDRNTVAAVVWHSNISQDREQVGRSAQPFVVKGIARVLNSDNEIVKQIEGVVNGVSMAVQYNDKMPEICKQIFDSVGPGDIIFYETDGKGIVSAMEKSFDARKLGEYGMSNNAMFDNVHEKWSPPVHLYRKVGYFRIEEKLHNNFFSYKNGEGAVCIQLVDPAAQFYKMTIHGTKVYVDEMTYNEVMSGDEVFSMYEYNRLKCMIVIDHE